MLYAGQEPNVRHKVVEAASLELPCGVQNVYQRAMRKQLDKVPHRFRYNKLLSCSGQLLLLAVMLAVQVEQRHKQSEHLTINSCDFEAGAR